MSRRTALLCSAVAACFLSPASLAHAEKLKVVASFSILGDMVAQIGGDRIDLTTLVGANGDAHVYAPTPKDVAAVGEAQLFVINGLGFEGWLERVVEASGSKATIVVAADRVKTIKSGNAGQHVEHSDDDHDHAKEENEAAEHADEQDHKQGEHQHGEIDPHAWQNVSNGVIYVGNIEKALCAADPAGCDIYTANARGYAAELASLHNEIKSTIAAIPEPKRKVIVSHDALGYFADAYGVTFLAPEGISTESEATAADVAKLVEQIRADKVTAVFVENIADNRLIQQIGRDTGAAIGGTLFSDALSPVNGPAATYLEMMRHNARTLAASLGGAS